MKKTLTISLILFSIYANAQLIIERNNWRYHVRIIDRNKLMLVGLTKDNDSTVVEIYNFYGELLNSKTIPDWSPYNNYDFFKSNNKFYAQKRNGNNGYNLLELDENLNYLNEYPLDSSLFKVQNSRTSFTLYNDKLYVIMNKNDSNLLIEMDNHGKVLSKILLPIKEKSGFKYDQMEIINGKFITYFYYNNSGYLINTKGECEKIGFVSNYIDNYVKVSNNIIYTAASAGNRYIFAKFNDNGKLIDSFSVNLPQGKRDNIGYLANNHLVQVANDIFYFSNEYDELYNNELETSIVYLVDYKNKRTNIIRNFESKSIRNYIAHYDGKATVFTYNKIITNDSNITKAYHSVIEFETMPSKCIISSFPNPSNKQFYINSPWFTAGSIAQITLYNSEGKLCFENNVITNKNTAFVNAIINNGLYHCMVKVNDKTCVFKQLIEE
ncbi:MAG: T9SS type A sorting domain-containing protein [Bacteroidia bacterium]